MPSARAIRKKISDLYEKNRAQISCRTGLGRPLLGGSLVAMRYGPVHSGVLDLINGKGEGDGTAEWARHFHNNGFYVVLDEDPGINALSRFEARILTETLQKYEEVEEFDLARLTHKFSEYVMNYKKDRRWRKITLEQLIHAVGGLSPMATSIVRDLKTKDEIDLMFSSAEEAPKKRQ